MTEMCRAEGESAVDACGDERIPRAPLRDLDSCAARSSIELQCRSMKGRRDALSNHSRVKECGCRRLVYWSQVSLRIFIVLMSSLLYVSFVRCRPIRPSTCQIKGMYREGKTKAKRSRPSASRRTRSASPTPSPPAASPAPRTSYAHASTP